MSTRGAKTNAPEQSSAQKSLNPTQFLENGQRQQPGWLKKQDLSELRKVLRLWLLNYERTTRKLNKKLKAEIKELEGQTEPLNPTPPALRDDSALPDISAELLGELLHRSSRYVPLSDHTVPLITINPAVVLDIVKGHMKTAFDAGRTNEYGAGYRQGFADAMNRGSSHNVPHQEVSSQMPMEDIGAAQNNNADEEDDDINVARQTSLQKRVGSGYGDGSATSSMEIDSLSAISVEEWKDRDRRTVDAISDDDLLDVIENICGGHQTLWEENLKLMVTVAELKKKAGIEG